MVEYAGVQDERQTITDGKAILDGMSESVTVEVFNPLTLPFKAQFARSIPHSAQLSDEERRLAALSGIKPEKDGGGVAHVVQYVVIEPGKTMKLPGNIAQNVVRQMVTYIIQQRGNKGLVSDPHLRREIEEELIVNYNLITKTQTMDVDEQLTQQLAELNNPESSQNLAQVLSAEPEFPTERNVDESKPEIFTTLSEETSGNGQTGVGSDAGTGTTKRPVGRPKAQAQATA